MDTRLSAARVWCRLLLAGAALALTACATETAEVQPAPTPALPPMAAPAPTPTPAPPPAAPVVEVPQPVEAPPPAAASPSPAIVAPAPPPAVAAPQGPIEVTDVAVQGGGQSGLTVVVTADGPIATYESFTLPDPPRLVVDIPNAIHAVPQPIHASLPSVMAIRSSQYRERPIKVVRLVFDLRSAVPYRVQTSENQLRVQLGAPGESQPAAQAAAPSMPASGGPGASAAPAGKVTRVDVQNVRGRQRIVIATSGQVSYTVNETSDPPSLTVDVTGATINPAASRTLDLRQVTSSVSRLRASQYRTEPDRVVRVVAELRNPIRYEAQKTGSTILVELQAPPRAAAAAPAAPAPAPISTEKPPAMETPAPAAAAPAAPASGRLSMDFKDADINNMLRIIAEVSGMNVVAGSDVSGKVTVRLVNVQWQQALDVILKINNMGYELDGNVIRVAPLAKLEAERRARDDARKREDDTRKQVAKTNVDLEPLETQVISVNYAKAADVVKNLDRLKTTGRPDTSINVDDRTNKLIIKETRDTLDKMAVLLKQLDLPTPQVLIEARLVEASRNFAQSIGIEWGIATNVDLRNLQAPPVSVFGSPVGPALFPPPPTGAGAAALPLAISLPANVAGLGAIPGVGIVANSLFNGKMALQARLSAAESEGKIKTLSAPRVATLDNQEAEIKQGTQVPYTTIDSSGRTVVAFQDAFIRLKVTPHITNDRRVSMKVEAERTDPGTQITFAGGFAFPLNTRKATTNVLVTNGGTIVIGGLLQTTDNTSDSGVPWLNKVPILGLLFKTDSVSKSRIELLIFLTPTILEEPRLS